jgi:VWFA-related protein
MLRKQFIAASLSALLVLPAYAQQQPAPPSYGETLEVRVVNLNVVVNDRDGNPVTGLTRDDFEVYENGKRKEITNFLEIDDRAAEGAKPAAAPRPDHLTLVLFVDNTTLHPFNRNRVLTAMRGFVEKTMRSGDMATVVTWNPGLKQDIEMTGDRARVLATLEAIAQKTGRGSTLDIEKEQTRDALRQMTVDFQLQPHEGRSFSTGDAPSPLEKPPYGPALGVVTHFADSLLSSTQQKGDAFRNVIAAVRGVEGRKALIFLTESFSMDPARQMFEFLDSVKNEFKDGITQNPRGEILHYNDDAILASVTSAANAAGVTLYPIAATGMSGGIDVPSVTENTMSNSAQMKSPGGNPDQALNELAGATGGLAVTGTNDFLRGFNRIANDLTAYYSIGYRGDPPSKDAVRSQTVKVKRPGLAVRNRETFTQKTPKTEVADTLSANMFAISKSNGMGITVTAGARTATGDDRISMPVDITIPMSALTLLPQGNELAGKFTVYTGFTRADGTTSQVKKNEYPIHFTAESLKRRESVTVRITVTMDKATETVSVGVVDQTSNATGFGMVKVL